MAQLPIDSFLNYWPRPRGSGIYAIINGSNGKIYIGSAMCLIGRWRTHRCELRNSKHDNPYLQKAFRKEPNSFQFEVVEQVQDKSKLLEREQFWMDFYQSHDSAKGYNYAKKAGSCAGIKRILTPKEKERMRIKFASIRETEKYKTSMAEVWKANIGRKHPPRSQEFRDLMSSLKTGQAPNPVAIAAMRLAIKERGINDKPVIQMDKNLRPIKRWKSITEAEIGLGFRSGNTNISYAAKGRRKFAAGFRWKYDDGTAVNCVPEPARIYNSRNRRVIQFDLNGNEISRFSSIDEARRSLPGKKGIWGCIQGRHKHAGGFVWKYEQI